MVPARLRGLRQSGFVRLCRASVAEPDARLLNAEQLHGALNVALRSFMPRTVDLDPLALGATAAVLFLVALFAAWLPAHRATKVDPLTALRSE